METTQDSTTGTKVTASPYFPMAGKSWSNGNVKVRYLGASAKGYVFEVTTNGDVKLWASDLYRVSPLGSGSSPHYSYIIDTLYVPKGGGVFTIPADGDSPHVLGDLRKLLERMERSRPKEQMPCHVDHSPDGTIEVSGPFITALISPPQGDGEARMAITRQVTRENRDLIRLAPHIPGSVERDGLHMDFFGGTTIRVWIAAHPEFYHGSGMTGGYDAGLALRGYMINRDTNEMKVPAQYVDTVVRALDALNRAWAQKSGHSQDPQHFATFAQEPLDEWRQWCADVLGPKQKADPHWHDPLTMPIRRQPNPDKQCNPSEAQVVSQKARGVIALRSLSGTGSHVNLVHDARFFPWSWPGTWDAHAGLDDEQPVIFARPCPPNPEHGYVDSRPVRTKREVFEMCDEIERTGVEPEIIFMPFMSATWSSILTPAGVSIGPGHEGATSGHDSLAIPAPTDKWSFWLHALRRAPPAPRLYGIKDGMWPYLEMVCNDTKNEVVQVRGGPPIDLLDTYVPRPMVVKRIVLAEGDLIEWGKRAKSLDLSHGDVVWHPGGTMASHYAVHCRDNKIALWLKPDPPKVGETIRKTKLEPLTDEDYQRIAQYIPAMHAKVLDTVLSGDEVDYNTTQWVVGMGAAVLHSQATWSGADHLLRLRAYGAIATYVHAAAACLGEARHVTSSRAEYRECAPRAPEWVTLGMKPHRETVHSRSFRAPVSKTWDALWDALHDFQLPGWGGSMGGGNWAACTKATLRLGWSITRFLERPCEATWVRLSTSWNEVINVAHNGGALLNKFTGCLEQASKAPGAFMAMQGWRGLWGIATAELPAGGIPWDIDLEGRHWGHITPDWKDVRGEYMPLPLQMFARLDRTLGDYRFRCELSRIEPQRSHDEDWECDNCGNTNPECGECFECCGCGECACSACNPYMDCGDQCCSVCQPDGCGKHSCGACYPEDPVCTDWEDACEYCRGPGGLEDPDEEEEDDEKEAGVQLTSGIDWATMYISSSSKTDESKSLPGYELGET